MKIKIKSLILVALFLSFGFGLLLGYSEIQGKVHLNLAAASSSDNSIIRNFINSSDVINRIQNANACRIAWYSGFIQDKTGNIQERNRYWGEAVVCDPELVYYLFNIYPDDKQLAEQRDRLIAEIAGLDVRFGEKEISKDVYQAKRMMLKTHLIDILKHLDAVKNTEM